MVHGLRAALFFLAIWAGASAWAQEATAPKRLALVVGNANYLARPLRTAANDAGLMATTLAQAGFEVMGAADTDAATWHKLMLAFSEKAQAAGPNAIVITYVSGYGLQVNGENMLVPVDAGIDRDVDAARQALPLSDLMRSLDMLPAKARIFIFDLARDTPFAKAGAPLASGLCLVEPKPGALIAFNTAPGAIAATDVAVYGIYARTLAESLATPGLPLDSLFERLRLRVAEITGGSSVPWDESKLDPTITLLPSVAGPPDTARLTGRDIAGLSSDVAFDLTIAGDTLDGYVGDLATFPTDPLARRVATMVAIRREALTWAASVKTDVASAYWTYMRRYPHGPHVLDARRRLAMLHAPLEPPPRFDLWDIALKPPAPEELAMLDRHPLTLDDPDWTPPPLLPDGFIPPSPPDAIDLSVPPLALAGALPLSMSDGASAPGDILQPFVPDYPDLLTRVSGATGQPHVMETTSAGAIIERTDARDEANRRTITQRDARNTIISRTTTVTGAGIVTSVQTGPTGGILRKVVTRTDVSGGHRMTLTNGRNQVMAEIDRDKNGIVTEMGSGSVPAPDESMIFEPATDERRPKTIPPVAPRPARDAPVPHLEPAIPPPPPDLSVEAPSPPAPAPPSLQAPSLGVPQAHPTAATPPNSPSATAPERCETPYAQPPRRLPSRSPRRQTPQRSPSIKGPPPR